MKWAPNTPWFLNHKRQIEPSSRMDMRIVTMMMATMMMATMWSNILYFHFRRNLATKGFWGFAQNVILELKGHPLSIIWIICFICWDIEEQVQFVLRAKQEIILLSFPFNSLNFSKMENPLNFTSSLLTPDLWLHFAQRPIQRVPIAESKFGKLSQICL